MAPFYSDSTPGGHLSIVGSSTGGSVTNLSECMDSVFVPPHTFQSDYFMPELYVECLKVMCNIPQKNLSLFCPPLFDGVGCWPSTKVNTTQTIPCPRIPFYDHSKFGSHACVVSQGWNDDGVRVSEGAGIPVWASHPDFPGLVWSDYSQCEHAILTDKYRIIQLIYYVGHLLSFTFTLLAFIIFAFFKKLHCPRNVVHMNFFGSIAVFCFFYFIQILLMHTLLTDTLLCNATHVVVQYCFQCTYFWMLCEAAYLHRTVVTNVFGHNEKLTRFILLGWGTPMLVISSYIAVNIAIGNAQLCWIESYADTFSWILEVPLIVCISVNLLLLISVLRVLIPKLNAATTSTSASTSSANRSTAGHDVAIKSAKAILFLSPLFGVHTIVTLWMPEEETFAHTVLGIIQALLQSSQGFVVAIVFCFGNSEVRNELKATFTMTTSMRRRRSTDVGCGRPRVVLYKSLGGIAAGSLILGRHQSERKKSLPKDDNNENCDQNNEENICQNVDYNENIPHENNCIQHEISKDNNCIESSKSCNNSNTDRKLSKSLINQYSRSCSSLNKVVSDEICNNKTELKRPKDKSGSLKLTSTDFL